MKGWAICAPLILDPARHSPFSKEIDTTHEHRIQGNIRDACRTRFNADAVGK